jgi:hypothetical protein
VYEYFSSLISLVEVEPCHDGAQGQTATDLKWHQIKKLQFAVYYRVDDGAAKNVYPEPEPHQNDFIIRCSRTGAP